MTINLTDPQAPVTEEELDHLILGLERYGLYPRQLAALKELRAWRMLWSGIKKTRSVPAIFGGGVSMLLRGHFTRRHLCRECSIQKNLINLLAKLTKMNNRVQPV
ncbi:hypothetical protein ACM26S_12330 [Kluyvera sichuanensis]|uniref:hypothetical protein n=1 Tax=Kluyvera sichuanensis TaxID=2725494 RepID=UPI0039F6F627